jgi:ribosomal protein S14
MKFFLLSLHILYNRLRGWTMYLIIVNRCTECGDELPKSYIKEFGLLCPVCIGEMAEIIREERKFGYLQSVQAKERGAYE